MKLISLNIWGGRVHEPLLSFIKNNASDTDIFCFQEVYRSDSMIEEMGGETMDGAYASIYNEIVESLPNHLGYFASAEDNWNEHGPTDFPLQYGNAIFIRKTLEPKTCTTHFVHKYLAAPRSKTGFSGARLVLKICFSKADKKYTVINFHGLHNGLGKEDSDERIAQSQKIKEILNQSEGPKILIGDFNLLPGTESMAILEEGMRSLIKEYGIISTRSSYYKKETKFADYALISSDIEVRDFKILDDEVSDHLALQLEFR